MAIHKGSQRAKAEPPPLGHSEFSGVFDVPTKVHRFAHEQVRILRAWARRPQIKSPEQLRHELCEGCIRMLVVDAEPFSRVADSYVSDLAIRRDLGYGEAAWMRSVC